MKEDKNNLSAQKLNPNLEHFKYEVAQELGISHRKKLNDKQPSLNELKRE